MQLLSTSDGGVHGIGGGNTGRSEFLSAIFCIIIAQLTMTFAAKWCSTSNHLGRKRGFSIATFVLTMRCFILSLLSHELSTNHVGSAGGWFVRVAILSMSILDGIGVGIVGCLYILILSDLANRAGRGARIFASYIGVASTAIGLGSALSSWGGEVVVSKIGFARTFGILGAGSAVIFVLHSIFMPETLASAAGLSSARGGAEERKQGYVPPSATTTTTMSGSSSVGEEQRRGGEVRAV